MVTQTASSKGGNTVKTVTLTAGEVTNAAVVAAPLTPSSGVLHVCVPHEDFALPFNGGHVTFLTNVRRSVEASIKAMIQASDKNVTWES